MTGRAQRRKGQWMEMVLRVRVRLPGRAYPMTCCPLYRHYDGSSPDSSEGAGRMGVTAGMNRAGGWPESGDVPTARKGKAATHKALPSCKEKAVSGFKSRPAHWVASYRRDTMDARQEEPPIDLDFDPVEKVDGDKLVEQQSELIQLLYDGYDPYTYDWHEDIHERQEEVWREIRDRSESEEPKCPECGAQRWAQSPGDPAYCRECGHEARAPRENAIHKAWDAMKEEVKTA